MGIETLKKIQSILFDVAVKSVLAYMQFENFPCANAARKQNT